MYLLQPVVRIRSEQGETLVQKGLSLQVLGVHCWGVALDVREELKGPEL